MSQYNKVSDFQYMYTCKISYILIGLYTCIFGLFWSGGIPIVLCSKKSIRPPATPYNIFALFGYKAAAWDSFNQTKWNAHEIWHVDEQLTRPVNLMVCQKVNPLLIYLANPVGKGMGIILWPMEIMNIGM